MVNFSFSLTVKCILLYVLFKKVVRTRFHPKIHRLAVMESEKVVKDRLSSLPDSIILHILSFLPTHEAVRTMLISKSFSGIWTLLPSIDLNWYHYRNWEANCNDYDSHFCEFLRNLLKHHKTPKIDMLRVNISNMHNGMNLGNYLKSCIDFALRKQVKTLELTSYVIEPHSMLFKWPSELISDSLVELSLQWIDLNSLTQVHLGKLRLLALSRVDMRDSVLGEIIRGCPLLREMKIDNCFNLSELSFVAPNVEKLIVDSYELSPNYDEHDNVEPSIMINCPNLKFLEFRGPAHSVEIVNLPSIVDVTFDLECVFLDFIEISAIISVLETLLCAKKVSFSDEFVTISFYYMLKQASHLPTINWTSASFYFWLTKKSIHGLNFMLRNTSHLKEVVINFTIRPEDDISESIEVQFEDDVLDKEECWMCLQSVTLHGIANTSYPVLVSFTELLLKKAPELNQLTFYYGRSTFQLSECYLTIEEMTKFAERTLKFSKAFPNVKISYVVG